MFTAAGIIDECIKNKKNTINSRGGINSANVINADIAVSVNGLVWSLWGDQSSSSLLTPLHSGLHCFLVRQPSCFKSPQQVQLAVNAGLLMSRLYTSRDRDVSVCILYSYIHKSTNGLLSVLKTNQNDITQTGEFMRNTLCCDAVGFYSTCATASLATRECV